MNPRLLVPPVTLFALGCLAGGAPLPVETVTRDTPVDYGREVAPFLKKNCFSCHNENKAKADLNLETVEAMLAGGDSGPALVPGKPMESLLFTYAAHLEDDPMPPANNKSKAENLTPGELGLLRLWIEQGAKGSSGAALAGPTEWQPLDGVQSIYAVAASHDGRFVACGRGNRLAIYDLRTGAMAQELRDEEAGMDTAHLDHIHSLAFSPDGTLASGGFRNVKLWERRRAVSDPLPYPLGEAPAALAPDPAGRQLATGDTKGQLAVHPLADGGETLVAPIHTAPVRALTWQADGAVIYSVSDDRILSRTSLADFQNPTKYTLPVEGLSIALLEGGGKIAVGGSDGVIRLVPATVFTAPADGEAPAIVELKGHGGRVLGLAPLDEGGTQLLSAGEDGTVRTWDLAGKELRQVNHGSGLVDFAYHRPSNRIATAGADGVIRLWDAANGSKVGELTGDLDFEVQRREITRLRDLAKQVAELRKKELAEREKQWNELRDKSKEEAGKITATQVELENKSRAVREKRSLLGDLQREIAALEAAGGQPRLGKVQEEAKKAQEELGKSEGELANAERAHQAAVRNSDLAVRDGIKAGERFLAGQAAAILADTALAAAEEAVKAIEAQAADRGPGALGQIAFSPDGATLAACSEKHGLKLWSATTFQPLDILHATGTGVQIAFGASGHLFAAFPDKFLVGWGQAAHWGKARQLGDPSDPDSFADRVLALAFHPRGHLLATGSGVPSRHSELKLWAVADGTLSSTIEKAHQDTITGLAFSPDGTRLASSSSDRFVKIHEIESGTLLEQLEGHTNHVLDVAWSADGETIASAGADAVAKLWVAAEGRQKQTEGGFKKELTTVSFLGNGEALVMAGGDMIVKAAGQNLGGNEGFVYDVDTTPDGALIVAGGEDGTLRVWQAQDRKLIHSFAPSSDAPAETASR